METPPKMPTYQQYRSYGHTRFTAWSLATPWWVHWIVIPLAVNAIAWGAAYHMGWL